jgi:hypothetical protein
MINKEPVNPFLSGIRDKSLYLPACQDGLPSVGGPAGFGIKSKRYLCNGLAKNSPEPFFIKGDRGEKEYLFFQTPDQSSPV